MKLKFLTLICVITLLTIPTFAQSYGIIGSVLTTDIRAYINGSEIPAYNVNGNMVIVGSDLRNYGFDVVYDNNARTSNVSYSGNGTWNPLSVVSGNDYSIGEKVMDVYDTDITVLLNGMPVTSYNVDGRMAFKFSELKIYGDYYYDNGTRTTNLWIDSDNFPIISQDTSKPMIFTDKTYLNLENKSEVVTCTLLNWETIEYEIDDNSIISCEWGEWNSDTIPLSIIPISSGQTYVKIYPQGYSDTVIIHVSVNMKNEMSEQHVHTYTTTIVAPKCLSGGYTTYSCICGYSYTADQTPAIGHTEVIDTAVPATPHSTGLTEGSHCSICGKVILKQKIIPKDTSSLVNNTTLSLVNNLSQEYSYVASQLYTRCKIEEYDYDVSYSYGDKVKLDISIFLKKTEQGKNNLNNLKLNYTLYHNGVAVKSSIITILNAEFDTLYESKIYYTGTSGDYTIKFDSVRY